MGQRQEPRLQASLPVRVFGTDAAGHVFSENISTLDISRCGARVGGVQAQVKPGEVIGLTYKQNRGRFKVQWAGLPGSPLAGQLGLMNMAPEKPMWDLPVPTDRIDVYKRQPTGADRRLHARLKCSSSVELHPEGQAAPIWVKALDLSAGGCFIEMPMPLRRGIKVKIGLWIREQKLWLDGTVVNSRPGFGIGVKFAEMSAEHDDRLRQFLKSITQLPI